MCMYKIFAGRVKSIQQQLYILSGLEYNLLLSEKSQFCEVKKL